MIRSAKICLALFTAVLLLGLAPPARAGEMEGKIKKVDVDRLEFVIEESNGKSRTIQMDEDAQILINNIDSNFTDLRTGDVVSIIGRQDGGNWMAVEVRCKRP
jgi:hypothetical protein